MQICLPLKSVCGSRRGSVKNLPLHGGVHILLHQRVSVNKRVLKASISCRSQKPWHDIKPESFFLHYFWTVSNKARFFEHNLLYVMLSKRWMSWCREINEAGDGELALASGSVLQGARMQVHSWGGWRANPMPSVPHMGNCTPSLSPSLSFSISHDKVLRKLWGRELQRKELRISQA